MDFLCEYETKMIRFSVFVIVLIATSCVNGVNIVIFPYPWKSFVFQASVVGEALIQKGHSVSMVLPASYPDLERMQSGPFEIIEYQVVEPDLYTMGNGKITEELVVSMMKVSLIEMYRDQSNRHQAICNNIFSDKSFFATLEFKSFDLAIVDTLPLTRCYAILVHHLGIPFVTISEPTEPWISRTPALPSFAPSPYSPGFTEKMTLWQRLVNLYIMIDWFAFPRVEALSDDVYRPYLSDKPYMPINKILTWSQLWLITSDDILDYPRPKMPNEIYVGGLTARPVQPLEQELQEFMDSATQGVIIVSFGTADVLPKEFLDKMLLAFTHITLHVIWRYPHEDLSMDVPGHIRLQTWLPQNDLLGHPNTKLFVTHCGTNSQLEALYHAVPMVGFPLFVDQGYNARRAEYHGYGAFLDITEFTPDQLVSMINNVINNKTYYDNVQKASQIMRSQPLSPRDRAAYWIEHVLQFGGNHLRSHALDMEWYEYLMLDILLFVCVFVMVICTVLYCICKRAIWLFNMQKCSYETLKKMHGKMD